MKAREPNRLGCDVCGGLRFTVWGGLLDGGEWKYTAACQACGRHRSVTIKGDPLELLPAKLSGLNSALRK